MKLPAKLSAKERTAAPLENAPPVALAVLMAASAPRAAATPPLVSVFAKESPVAQVENAPLALLVAQMVASVPRAARNANVSAQKRAAVPLENALMATCAAVDPAHAQKIVDVKPLPVMVIIRSSSPLQ